MKKMKIGQFLSFLLYFHPICRAAAINCSNLQEKSLSCYSDFNYTINCVWNSSYVSVHKKDVCTLYANKTGLNAYNGSCDLKPSDVSNPALRSCSVQFKRRYIFQTFHRLLLNVNCTPSKRNESMEFKPSCHVKLNPPRHPKVNQTTVTWFTPFIKNKIDKFQSELQWKQKDGMSWNKHTGIQCEDECESHLDPSLLIKDETYEARARVRVLGNGLQGPWSDWSPTEIWVSQVGKPKTTLEWGAGVTTNRVLTLALSGLLLAGILILMRKKQLIYVVKNFKSGPLPDPAKSEIFQDWFILNPKDKQCSIPLNPEKSAVQTWLSSHFTGKSVQSFLNSVDIDSNEVTSKVDDFDFFRPDVKLMPEKDENDSSGSSFSNPSYSEICTSICVSSVKLQACSVDVPCNPFHLQGEEESTEQDGDAVKKDQELVKLLFMGVNKKEPVVISDYEKVENQQSERFRLRSVDSGMCSCEEVSQESMEAESINMTEGHDEVTPHTKAKEVEDREENKTKLDFQSLFGGSSSILGKNQICLDYKQIPTVQPGSPELPSQDLGVRVIDGENESQEESTKEDNKLSEMTCLLLPPHPLYHSSIPQQSLNMCESTVSSPLYGNDILKQIALSGSVPRQSCCDGYMPVRQKE